MPNPDSGNLPSALANSPPKFKRKSSGSQGTVNEKTANWQGLPGKSGPNRSAGVKKLKVHPMSKGL
ncbi:MAG: hypothetical protein ABUK15_07395 [Anaerolineales bacterium]